MKQCHSCGIYKRTLIIKRGKKYCPSCFKEACNTTENEIDNVRQRTLKAIFRVKELIVQNRALLVVLTGLGIGIFFIIQKFLILGLLLMWLSLLMAFIPHILSEINCFSIYKKSNKTILLITEMESKVNTLIKSLNKDYYYKFQSIGVILNCNIVRSKEFKKIIESKKIGNYESYIEIKLYEDGKQLDYDDNPLFFHIDLITSHYLYVWINKLEDVTKELHDDFRMAYNHVYDLYQRKTYSTKT